MLLSYKYHTFNIPLCLLRYLKRHMCYVRAAGGITVFSGQCSVFSFATLSGASPLNTEHLTLNTGKMLLIQRNGRWDLPKGKVEPGETLLQAALREVEEETGIKASDECGVMSVERIGAGNSSLITHHSSVIKEK